MAIISSVYGAPRIGNPITVSVTAASPSGTISFHRVKLKVVINGSNEIEMSSPVNNGEVIDIDVSSALRSVADSYEYSYSPTTYPVFRFTLVVWDEYMSDGELHTTEEYTSTTFYALLGGYTDFERSTGKVSISGKHEMSRKPLTGEIVAVGETYAYTPDKSGSLQSITAPESHVNSITTEGLQTINGRTVYALPSREFSNRQVFRFVNGLGVLESVSVQRVSKKTVNITTAKYIKSRVERFNSVSRIIVRKQNDKEAWSFSTDMLDEKWASWYVHEFLMAEHVWISIGSSWVPCTIDIDDDITLRDDEGKDGYQISFTAKIDVCGSVLV